MIIRPSLLNKLRECPQVGHAASRSLPSGRAASDGTLIHAWIETYLRREYAGLMLPLAPVSAPWLAWQFPLALRELTEKCGHAQLRFVPEVRAKLALTSGGDIEGTCDAYDPRCRVVVDWKTGHGGHLVRLREDLQLACYGHALEAQAVARVHLSENSIAVEVESMCDMPTVAEIEDVIVAARSAPDDVPELGEKCETCFHKSGCRAYIANLDELDAAARERLPAALIDAPGLLSRWLRVKALGSQIEASVKGAGAPVTLDDGRVYGPGEGRRNVADVDRAVVELARLGIVVEPKSKSTLSLADIEKAAGKERKGAALAALEEAGIVTRSVEWGAR